ncbi:uncharacterized protein CDAR_17241 [Caerostris darwini]|uniref:Uncharacterized protein n=1 Tax=Caerostris darwini TaxID=1538125 RepID=A0AAV4M6Q5_9ARAC|nr:uncharacterized protein CDAR_17241 [Caerostris darwini]
MNSSQNLGERKYGRDYLLQLRLHPFSLQKPKHLKEHDIVKDKLYLHQLNGIGSQNANLSMPCTYSDYVHMALKQDPETLIRYHHSMPDCFSRNCLPYVSGRKGHVGMHAISSSKNRQLYIPDYVAPMRKIQLQNPSDYEFDVLRDDVYCSNVPWSKQCCPFSDDMRRQNQQSDHDSSSKISFEGSSKNKKKALPIIDPKNGKNILDGICTTSQESIISEETDGDSETKSSTLISENNKQFTHEEQNIDDSIKNEKVSQGMISDDDFSSSSQLSESIYQNLTFSNENPKEENISEDLTNSFSSKTHNENFSEFESNINTNRKNLAGRTSNGSILAKHVLDSDYELYKKFACNNYEESKLAINDSLESYEGNNSKDINASYHYLNQMNAERYKSLPMQENKLNFEEQLKHHIKLLREKIYSVRQEQQKMAILQSFLRFKKHQLDESYRRLDDKKMEIANWECNLTSKAKKLQEKDCRLEAKRLTLFNKESELEEREKKLNENANMAELNVKDKVKVEKITSLKDKIDGKENCSIDYELGNSSIKELNEKEKMLNEDINMDELNKDKIEVEATSLKEKIVTKENCSINYEMGDFFSIKEKNQRKMNLEEKTPTNDVL